MQCRTDVQDLAFVVLQFSKRRAADIERAFEIDVYDGAKAVRRKLFRRAKKISGGAVDDDIYLAESFNGRSNRLLNFFGFADVCGDGEGFSDGGGFVFCTLPDGRVSANAHSPRVINCFRGRLEMFEAATDECHVRTGFRQSARDAAVDARTPPAIHGT